MKSTVRLALAASATFAFASLGAVAPAQADTMHCDPGLGKTELTGAGPSYQTTLAAGTPVCIKAGTKTYYTTVGADGWIVQDSIKNKPGNAYLGISYFVWYECTDEYTCGGGSTGGS